MLLPVGVAAAVSMLAHGEQVPVPAPLLIAATVLLASSQLIKWLSYRVVVGCGVGDVLRAMLASYALSHTITVASASALLGRKLAWQRTDKFTPRCSILAAVRAALVETVIGVTLLASAVLLASLADGGLVAMLAVGGAMGAISYLSAPAVALLSERDLRRVAAVEPATAMPKELPIDLVVLSESGATA